MHPGADPAALAARSLPRLQGRILVAEVPGDAEAERLGRAGDGELEWFSTDWTIHRTLSEAGLSSFFGAWVPPRSWEGAVVFLPRARERTRMLLAMMASALEAGAPLLVAGAKGGGIESAVGEVARVAEVEAVESGRHSRLIRARIRERRHASLEDHRLDWTLEVGGQSYPVASFPGVFSHGRVDPGTRLLLDSTRPPPGPLLDVGCGAGVIATVLGRGGSRPTTLVDVDALALESARRTLSLNGLEGRVEAADVYPRGGSYASIVSNPPFHRGGRTDHGITRVLVGEAPNRLTPGGTLTLVCNQFLPVPPLLDRAFGGHEVVAEDGRYRVYRAVRSG